MAKLNDFRTNGQHRFGGRASVCRPAPRRYGGNDWRLAARLGFIGRHRRAACPPKIAKTPRSPARPRAICWYGRRIAGGLLYVVCGGGAKRQIDTATYSLPRKDNCIFALLYLICYNNSAKLLQRSIYK